MDTNQKDMLYKALKVYAFIFAHFNSCDECKKFCEMLKALSDELNYDFTDA